ncbi:MAG TPA: CHAT domain-containing protein [Pyrinomonadaceae bacterium]|nr:CHAT domain-containing protein [Chloracidobacterium sp.]HRJ87325.1 CHAT domain-containing protein [Pyrinomonadaceae bacterium]HRK51066.1 CHAT domain-containing protein [Pyrinomonadaceae bacterium]
MSRFRTNRLIRPLLVVVMVTAIWVPLSAQSSDERAEAEGLMRQANELLANETPRSRDDALAKFAAALTIWRRLGDEKQQAAALQKMADITYYRGDVRQSLEHSLMLLPITRRLGDRDLEGTVLANIGWTYDAVGEPRKGLEFLQQAHDLFVGSGQKQKVASVLNGIGTFNYYLGNIEIALENFNRSLAIRREVNDRRGEALVLINLGKSFDDGGEKQKAIEYYESALAITEELKDTRNKATVLNNLGSVQQDLGDFQKAFDLYQTSLRLRREIGDGFGEAASLNNLASLYRTLGDFDQALALMQEVRLKHNKSGSKREEAKSLGSIGAVYWAMNDRSSALDHYSKALELHQSIENNEGRAVLLRNIGLVHLESNDARTAIPYFQQSLELAETAGDAASVGDIVLLLARAFASLNENENAVAGFARAEEIQRKNNFLADLPETLFRSAQFDLKNGKNADSLKKMAEAHQILDDLRVTISAPGLRASFLAERHKFFDSYITQLVAQHRAEPGKGWDAIALKVSESARARSLLDSLGESHANIRSGIDPGLRTKETLLRQTINSKESQRIEAVRSGSVEGAAALERELTGLFREYRLIQAEIRRTSPNFAALTSPEPLDLPLIQASLDPDSVLLEYFVGTENSFLFLITDKELSIFQIPKQQIVDDLARRALGAVKARGTDVKIETLRQRNERIARADRDAITYLNRLGDVLLKPVAARLEKKRLLIVSSGILQYLPFGALMNPASGAGASRKHLIETNEVVSLPSASIIPLLRRKPAETSPSRNLIAVFADPVFSNDDPRVSSNEDSKKDETALAVMNAPKLISPRLRSDFSRLRFTRTEAEAIATLTPDSDVFLAMDFAANVEAATGDNLRRSRYIHLATHGVVNSDFPELSGIVLSLFDQSGRPRDGFLRLHDVYNLQIAADLVVLSACETGLGKDIKGEGIVGLTRGFMYAGAPRVMASLWRVEDRATADLMRRFYQRMFREGLAPAAALRDAQVSMLKERSTRQPFFWAGFTLQGEWRPIPN